MGALSEKVFLRDSDVNLKMLEGGMAWHYKQYAKEQSPADRTRYAQAEELARTKKVGLWRDVHPIPPWEFRHPSQGIGGI